MTGTVKPVIWPGQPLIVQAILPGQSKVQMAGPAGRQAFGQARVQPFETTLVEHVGAVIDQAAVDSGGPLPYPGGGPTVAGRQSPIQLVHGCQVDIRVGQAEPVSARCLPVELPLGTRESHEASLLGTKFFNCSGSLIMSRISS